MRHSSEMVRCLEQLDVAAMRRLAAHVFSHLPAPGSDDDVLARMHLARTQMPNIRFKLRAYSHSWLMERSLPSGLPDELRPRAQRIYPVVVSAVGISVNAPAHRRELADALQGAMENVVREMYADGVKEPGLVRARMMEARNKMLRSA